MTPEEKFENKKDQLAGKAKEVGGKVTGDKKLEAEGKSQGVLGKAKEKLDDAKDTVKGATESVKKKLSDNED